MKQFSHHSLKARTSFQVDAFAEQYIRFDTQEEIFEYLADSPLTDRRHMVLGGGSNLLFCHDFDGVVLHPDLKGIEIISEDADSVQVRAMAGESWDDFVAFTVDRGLGGVENLSLIPGTVGASAVQNIGAYGVEAKDVIHRVEAISLQEGTSVTLPASDCGFGYRYSHFKGPWNGIYLITAVVYRLCRKPNYRIDYPGVKEAVERAGGPSLQTLRRAIIDIRQSKLPDPETIGNAGSFFKNPVVSPQVLNRLKIQYPGLPCYPEGASHCKLAAGWLIDQCGWKGKTLGRAGVHDKQALVLVNHGGASGQEIFELSEQIRASVFTTFGVELEREVVVI